MDYYFGFFLKKLISAFLLPLPLCLGVIGVGLLFLWFTQKQKVGKVLVTGGAVLLFLLSSEIVSVTMISPLDQAYPVYRADRNNPVKFVVVLSGGGGSKGGIPLNTNSYGTYATLSRLMEGIRVYKCNPNSKIVLTGKSFSNGMAYSELEAWLLVNLGIPVNDLLLDKESLDTFDEAVNVKKIVKNEPFVLVSSASHLPRALKLFQKQGMNPIPAPTDFETASSLDLSASGFIPDTRNICSIDVAIHEYLGILWSRMRGQL